MSSERYVVVADHLAATSDRCTGGACGPYGHEPTCGLEPIGPVDEILEAARVGAAAWVRTVVTTRPVTEGPTVLALARALERDESTPPALRTIAAAYLRSKVTDHPGARLTDPATSREAHEKIRDVVRSPGGKLHRVLAAYGAHARRAAEARHPATTNPSARRCADEQGLTAREVEDRYGIPQAHKRTSELLRDGLLEVIVQGATARGYVDLVREGGRVLRITTFGRQELDRLNEIQPMIE